LKRKEKKKKRKKEKKKKRKKEKVTVVRATKLLPDTPAIEISTPWEIITEGPSLLL